MTIPTACPTSTTSPTNRSLLTSTHTRSYQRTQAGTHTHKHTHTPGDAGRHAHIHTCIHTYTSHHWTQVDTHTPTLTPEDMINTPEDIYSCILFYNCLVI